MNLVLWVVVAVLVAGTFQVYGPETGALTVLGLVVGACLSRLAGGAP